MEEHKPLLVNDPAPGQAAQVPIPGTSKSVDDLIKHGGNRKLHLSKQRDSIFFTLPLELRLLIYRELLPPAFQASSPSLPEQLALKSKGKRARKVLSHRHQFRRYLPSCLKLHLEILRTCRAIFAETIPILYREKAVTVFARSGQKKEAPEFSMDGIEPDEISHLQRVLRYAHHLHVIIVNIVFHGGLEDDFRHKVDCIFSFLQKTPQVDNLLVRLGVCCPGLDSPKPKSVGYGASQRMARNTVECVLGRLHNIRKVWVMESMTTTFCFNGSWALVGSETPETDSWAEDLAKKMMSCGQRIT